MTDTLPNPLWATIAIQLVRSLESEYDVTALAGAPPDVTPLPEPLGGDPAQRPALALRAGNRLGFLEILRAKAHHLLLPERLVDDIRDSGIRLVFSDMFQGGEATTRYLLDTVVAVQLRPGTSAFLAGLGGNLGRRVVAPDLAALDTIYHELCHAWMIEVVADDPYWRDLRARGIEHYADARVASGVTVDAYHAYLEAAGSYVGSRVAEWYEALHTLSNAALLRGTIPDDALTDLVESARATYERRRARAVYGMVSESAIVSPGLPEDLRRGLDAYVLSSLPLTRPFDLTPLRAYYDALLGSGTGGSGGGAPLPPDVRRHLAATVLAEAAEGQDDDVAWVYLTLVTLAKGEAGLRNSAAFRRKSIMYRIWLYLLGEQTYARDRLPDSGQFADNKGQSIRDYCEKNPWMASHARPRATRMAARIDDMLADPSANPYPGWTRQGSLDDFNSVSSPGDLSWKKARAYWWLQDRGEVTERYVKMLPAGQWTQFLFNITAIDAYFRNHPLPADVPPYVP
jgi:hypothetical protein